jgi:pilin isopeptide linkage protein
VKEGTFTLPTINTASGADATQYFTKAGVYRYQVYEVADANTKDDLKNLTYDATVSLVDVFVLPNSDNDGLYIAGIASHDAGEESKEPIEFVNSCDARSLAILKEVTGSGSSTQDFSFTLNVAADQNLTTGAKLYGKITRNDDSWTDVEITVGSDYAFTLKDGERLDIYGLFDETHYTVAETATDGYSTKIKSTRYDSTNTDAVTQTTTSASANSTEGEVYGADATERFINHGTTTSTGIALTITPIAIAGGLAAAGAILVVTKRKLKK